MADDRSPHIAKFLGGNSNPNQYDNEPTRRLMAGGRAEGGPMASANYMPAQCRGGEPRSRHAEGGRPGYDADGRQHHWFGESVWNGAKDVAGKIGDAVGTANDYVKDKVGQGAQTANDYVNDKTGVDVAGGLKTANGYVKDKTGLNPADLANRGLGMYMRGWNGIPISLATGQDPTRGVLKRGGSARQHHYWGESVFGPVVDTLKKGVDLANQGAGILWRGPSGIAEGMVDGQDNNPDNDSRWHRGLFKHGGSPHAEGGAAKVRKGIMTQKGRAIDRD